MADEQKVFIPPKRVNTDYPVRLKPIHVQDRANKCGQVIDTDPYVPFEMRASVKYD